jgi:hypothetical protein
MHRLAGTVYIGRSVRVPETALREFIEGGGDLRCDEHAPVGHARPVADPARKRSARIAHSARTEHWLGKLRGE